jgi:S-adenosylmethionine/arginine decarboxylase-like enzyme
MAQFNAGKTVKIICSGCDQRFIDDQIWMENFLLYLSKTIGMTKLLGPISRRLISKSEPEKEGVSTILMIAESHIACHCWRDDCAARFIIDSCKDFDVNLVIGEIKKMLRPKEINIGEIK